MNIDLGLLGPVVLMECEYYWEKYDYMVVMDGFTKDGLRVHVVKGRDNVRDISPMPNIIDNAIVISLDGLPKNQRIRLGDCRL